MEIIRSFGYKEKIRMKLTFKLLDLGLDKYEIPIFCSFIGLNVDDDKEIEKLLNKDLTEEYYDYIDKCCEVLNYDKSL